MNGTLKGEETLKVFVRVRPPIYKEVKLENAVTTLGSNGVVVSHEGRDTSCSYHAVFSELSEQEEVFERVKPLLIDTLSGINSCIFAYGQTSSGKSFTMIGPNGGQDVLRCDRSLWGILPRAADFLLSYLSEKAEEGLLSYEVKASFLQIYNENLYDLLRDSGPMIDDHLAKDSVELKIREVPRPKSLGHGREHVKEVFVSGLSEFRVETSEDILRILTLGTTNRMTRSTDFNLTSSRSHALLQLTFEIEQQVESGQTLISRSKLNLIDLAGSEKIPISELANTKQHVKELTAINKSLSALGNVIAALASPTRPHIPYRDSKLTRILQDSLGGNTKTILIACVAPTVLHITETLSTLQFADRAKNVRITVKANTVVDDKLTLAKAQAEIARLKALLAHTMKQLQAKNHGNNGNTNHNTNSNSGADGEEEMDIEHVLAENDALRRENESLRKISMRGIQPHKGANASVSASAASNGSKMKPSRSLDALTSPRAQKQLMKKNPSGDVSDDESVRSSVRKLPANANKAKVGFNSGLDRFGNRVDIASEGVSNAVNNNKPKKKDARSRAHSSYDSGEQKHLSS